MKTQHIKMIENDDSLKLDQNKERLFLVKRKLYSLVTFLGFISDGLDSDVFLDEDRFKADVSTSSSSNFGRLIDLDELLLGPVDVGVGVLVESAPLFGINCVEEETELALSPLSENLKNSTFGDVKGVKGVKGAGSIQIAGDKT